MAKSGEWPHADHMQRGFPIEGADVKSCRRTLEIFEFFAEIQKPMSMAEISASLKYPQSSTIALLKTLTSLGYLEYQADEKIYRPTIRSALIGGWLDDRFFLGIDVLDFMRQLATKTKFDVVVGIQNGPFVQHLMRIAGSGDNFVEARTGTLRPMCRTAIGLALLTTKSNSQVSALLRAANLTEDPQYRVREPDILADVEKARRSGVSVSYGRFTPEHGGIATLLPTHEDAAPMAIGVLGHVDFLKRAEDAVKEHLLWQKSLVAQSLSKVESKESLPRRAATETY